MAPAAAKIMIVRHAEKPTGQADGVDESGANSAHDLIVRGWQRAGALAVLFAPAQGPLGNALLATPDFLFASAAADDPVPGNSKSRRPQETLMPLALKLALVINLSFSKGQEEELAAAAQACAGPVLIAWQHEAIPAIANAILGDQSAPQAWPSSRFDLVFVFTLAPATGTYDFAQVPQSVLAGDLATTL